MSDQPVMVSKFSWDEVFPWTIIFKTLPIAAGFTVLVLATLGVFATPMGWLLSETLFINETTLAEDVTFAEMVEINRSPYRGVLEAESPATGSVEVLGVALSGPKLVYHRFVDPFTRLFAGDLGFRKFGYLLFGCIWTLIVWAFFGTAISRVCLLRLCRDEQSGLDDGFEFAIDNFGTTLSALSMPLLGITVLVIPNFLIGLLLNFDFGTVVGGLIWVVVILLSFCIALLLLGLMFGWPLMVASVSCESQNSLDAMTRSFAYTFQRPLQYLFYSVIAVLFGGFCWFIISKLALATIGLSFWTTSWGANASNSERMLIIRGEQSQEVVVPVVDAEQLKSNLTQEPQSQPQAQSQINNPAQNGNVQDGNVQLPPDAGAVGEPSENPIVGIQVPNENLDPADVATDKVTSLKEPRNSRSLQFGQRVISFWTSFARTVAVAFLYGLFWCMASAIYLLLRYDVDETEMDEVYQVDERRTYELPPLVSDADGIPQVQTPQPIDDEES
jgi:hypothetical protein